ncbi:MULTISPECIES: BglG family transcription antiterminator LicT [Clostridium]|uniref:Beta-glucoside operon transcriptional antiterminator n=1 Tax=Clostridium beijerinckii TaxID=1520 RepID=A0A1S8QP92_CLOBE|nr:MULTISPECIES: PRD domain-containing protein [Clostridium]MBE6090543.1 PRD domain-containing protein [Clostridium beijerinckii]NOW91052.1 beta-glucoside operon transcriptional antiterminator [Clostridium beijerinckii]NRT72090.1 beta-glucoside operon transcriptional antiterminator [Clostridium beijerinckii]NRT80916.1 beta-glucoside operon transcriptional antiterminator [Clostridium beijerinckii]NSB14541.1 beta-glucoside operon transcriptional antiterminator [Clostridium beijerinckii]
MKIEKVINNNLVQSFDNNNKEVLVMGCGLGFKKKAGEIIDKDKVEKIYSLEDKNYSNKLIELLSDIPLEVIQTTNEIVSYARYSLGKKLNDNIYILLTDHISFAMERVNKGLQFKNALLWEIKRFYNHEFLIGKEALQIIEKRLHVDLPEDEAANIALHIVNAQLNSSNIDDTMSMTNMIQNILNIVKFHYKLELDEYSLHYERFITHLKFFSQRIFRGNEIEDEDTSLSKIMREKYKEAYKCAEKIKKYVKSEFNSELTDEEMMYLAVHINRVTKQTE